MKQNKLKQQVNISVKNNSIRLLNSPKRTVYHTKINGEKLNILVEVQEDVVVGQVLAKIDDERQIKSTISGKVISIEEKQNKDASFSFAITVENNFSKESNLKKIVNPNKDELIKRMEEGNLQELLALKNEKVIVVNAKDNRNTFSLKKAVLNNFETQILKGANYIKKAFLQAEIFILVHKHFQLKLNEQIEKLNLKGIKVITKSIKKAKVIDIQTPLDFYEAVNFGVIKTKRTIFVGGESIKEVGFYTATIGTPIDEIIDFCGGLKHTYEEIEAYKEDAKMAVFDQIQIKKELKNENDKVKKQELKNLLQEKKQEAQKIIFSKFELQKENYKKCLAEIVFYEDDERFTAKGIGNVVEPKTQAILFLSNKQKKNRVKK